MTTQSYAPILESVARTRDSLQRTRDDRVTSLAYHERAAEELRKLIEEHNRDLDTYNAFLAEHGTKEATR